jgi:hypothetical protein
MESADAPLALGTSTTTGNGRFLDGMIFLILTSSLYRCPRYLIPEVRPSLSRTFRGRVLAGQERFSKLAGLGIWTNT